MICKLVKSKKTGLLEAEPEFTKEKVIFHPLPKSLQVMYREGDEVEGEYGIERPSERYDKRNVPIFTAFFIPAEQSH
jgi:hypothetical protein